MTAMMKMGRVGQRAVTSCLTEASWEAQNIRSNITLATLKSYANGTWLDNENNPSPPICCISAQNCTAKKMVLTLLDYLFHHEVQAVTNL